MEEKKTQTEFNREDSTSEKKTDTYKSFVKDKRERTSSYGEGKRENRREGGNNPRRGNESGGSRTSYNPNFTKDNRPAWKQEESGEKKTYGERDGGERRPYGERKEYGDRKPFGERKEYGNREGGERRPYGERKEYGDRKPFGERKEYGNRDGGERRPYGERKEFGSDRGERKEYGDRKPFGERKEYGNREGGERRTYGERKEYGDRKPFGERKEYGNRDGGERRPYGERKEYGDRKPFGERKEYGNRDGGERRPYGERKEYGDRKPFGERKEYGNRDGGERRPYGERKEYGDRKPFGERKEYGNRDGGERRPYGERKEYGDRKPFGERRESSRGRSSTPTYNSENYPTFPAPVIEDQIRLNRYISMSGICSRREADEFIKSGAVTVNDVVITELGTKVSIDDVIKFNGEVIVNEKKVYIVMNKPKGYVTSLEDPHAEKTVMDLIKNGCRERVYPVGRLDKSSMGVLLISNDGDLAKKLTHPSYEKKKVYQVTLDKALTRADMDSLVQGIQLEDGEAHVDAISYVGESKTDVGVEIHSGRNRIVRRMFEHLGYRVNKLDRVYFAGLTKQKLRRGEWRFLTPREVQALLSGLYE